MEYCFCFPARTAWTNMLPHWVPRCSSWITQPARVLEALQSQQYLASRCKKCIRSDFKQLRLQRILCWRNHSTTNITKFCCLGFCAAPVQFNFRHGHWKRLFGAHPRGKEDVGVRTEPAKRAGSPWSPPLVIREESPQTLGCAALFNSMDLYQLQSRSQPLLSPYLQLQFIHISPYLSISLLVYILMHLHTLSYSPYLSMLFSVLPISELYLLAIWTWGQRVLIFAYLPATQVWAPQLTSGSLPSSNHRNGQN